MTNAFNQHRSFFACAFTALLFVVFVFGSPYDGWAIEGEGAADNQVGASSSELLGTQSSEGVAGAAVATVTSGDDVVASDEPNAGASGDGDSEMLLSEEAVLPEEGDLADAEVEPESESESEGVALSDEKRDKGAASALQTQQAPAASASKAAVEPENALVANGVYTISQGGVGQLFLDAADDSRVAAKSGSYAASQKWRLTSLAGGLYRIDNVGNGRSLQVSSNNASTASVSQGAWSGDARQQWRVCLTDKGAVLVPSLWTGKVLQLAGGAVSLANWDGKTVAGGVFAFDYATPVLGDEYIRLSNDATGLSLGVAGDSAANGARVEQSEFALSSGQLFRAAYDESTGYYSFIAASSGKALQVDASADARVVQAGANDGLAQKWQVVRNADGTFSFFSALTGNVLGFVQNARFAGDSARVLAEGDLLSTRWHVIVSDNPVSAGVYTLTSAANLSRMLDAGRANGSLVSSKASGSADQQFVIEQRSNGRYFIRNASTGLYVARSATGALVQVKAGVSGCQYDWEIDLREGGYTITAPDGRAIETFGNGSVGLAAVAGSLGQRFLLDKQTSSRSAQIEDVKYGRTAIVTIIDDDGIWSNERKLAQLALKYKLAMTEAMAVSRTADHTADWKGLVDAGYLDTVSHTYSHPLINASDPQTWTSLEHELGDAATWLAQNFGTESVGFVTPYNSSSDIEIAYLVENGCYAIRSGYRGFGTLSPEWGTQGGQWLNLAMQNMYAYDTIAKKNALLDQAVAGNNWLIEMWHAVGDPGWESVSEADADAHLSYMKKLSSQDKLWVASFTDASKYLHEKQHCTVSTSDGHNEVFVSLDRTDDFLPASTFNAELTVKVEIPSSWKGAKAAGGTAARISVSNGKRYASFEMRPDTSVSLQRTW